MWKSGACDGIRTRTPELHTLESHSSLRQGSANASCLPFPPHTLERIVGESNVQLLSPILFISRLNGELTSRKNLTRSYPLPLLTKKLSDNRYL